MSAVRRIPLKQRVPGLLLSLIRFVIIFGLAFIILKPFVYKILMAFMSPDDLLDSTVRLVPRHFSLYYWKTALEGLNLGQTLRNTGLLSLLVGVIQVASCTMIGYGLAVSNSGAASWPWPWSSSSCWCPITSSASLNIWASSISASAASPSI